MSTWCWMTWWSTRSRQREGRCGGHRAVLLPLPSPLPLVVLPLALPLIVALALETARPGCVLGQHGVPAGQHGLHPMLAGLLPRAVPAPLLSCCFPPAPPFFCCSHPSLPPAGDPPGADPAQRQQHRGAGARGQARGAVSRTGRGWPRGRCAAALTGSQRGAVSSASQWSGGGLSSTRQHPRAAVICSSSSSTLCSDTANGLHQQQWWRQQPVTLPWQPAH